MKLTSFKVNTPFGTLTRIGAVEGEEIIDLNLAYQALLTQTEDNLRAAEIADAVLPPDMLRFLEGGSTSRRAAQRALEFGRGIEPSQPVEGKKLVWRRGEIQPAAVITRPPMIRDFLTFETHMVHSAQFTGLPGVPKEWYEIPVCFKKNTASVIGDGEDIIWPRYTEKLDYELEVAVVIGRKGKNIPKEEADQYIAGYTIFNDVSARDIQAKEMTLKLGPFKGKDFDTAGVLGPYLVTPDELADSYNLKMEARINGEVWSSANTGDMYWRFPDLIAYLSQDETLYPGDVLGSGTPGYGSGYENERWVQPGDVIEFEVEGLGVLRNKVVKP